MALLPQDRRGQILVVLTILALAGLYVLYAGSPIGSWLTGWSALGVTKDSLQNQIDSLDNQVKYAQRIIRAGTVTQLERRLAEYRATLDLMRQLVPVGEEMPNLFDDITSRAKVRGANVVNIVPATLESGTPFDTKRARVQVAGSYDQIGEYLADIASLPRIIVPYDIRITRITSPTADTSMRRRNMLVATFQIRTYVRPQVAATDTTARPAGAAAPAPRRG